MLNLLPFPPPFSARSCALASSFFYSQRRLHRVSLHSLVSCGRSAVRLGGEVELNVMSSFKHANPSSSSSSIPPFSSCRALDMGTTSTRFIVFDEWANNIASYQVEFDQHYPHPG